MYIKKYFYFFQHLKKTPNYKKLILIYIYIFQKTLLNTYIPKIKKLMHDSKNYLAFDHSILKINIINLLWVFVIIIFIHL
jgi:hypothetical protein